MKIREVFKVHSFSEDMKFEHIREQLIQETKQKIKQSVSEDIIIIQAATTLETLTTTINTLTEKLRNWHELYNPEFSHTTTDNTLFVEALAHKKNRPEGVMGGKLDEKDITALQNFAKTIQQLLATQQDITTYIETKIKNNCPNTATILGTTLTAKLLTLAGSLKKLAFMPASTIQLLGAEKALFRHLKQGTKIPKYGIIALHPIIQKVKHGKAQSEFSSEWHRKGAARMLANKIAIAARVDYFKGAFIGDKLKQQLEQRFT